MNDNRVHLPLKGTPRQDVLNALVATRQRDVNWRDGRVFGLVFNAGDEVTELLKESSLLFFSENGLTPTAFPGLKTFETEVVAMIAGSTTGMAARGST